MDYSGVKISLLCKFLEFDFKIVFDLLIAAGSTSSNSLGAGAIAGIVIGSVVGIGLIVAALVFFGVFGRKAVVK